MALHHSSDKLTREFDNFGLKFYKSSTSSSNFQRLPKCWNIKDRSKCLRLSHFALTVTYSSGFSERHDSNYSNNEVACVRSDSPIPLTTGIYYFEITVLNKGSNGSLSLGVMTKTSSLNKFPGSEHNSFGYQSDGCIYNGFSSPATKFGPTINENDTVGCGIDFLSQSLFFTRNGIFLGKAFEGKLPVASFMRFYPTVGLQGRGVRLSTNFGQYPFQYAFENHIKSERLNRENKLMEKICKEDFTGLKMKELVSGYLVHHGYVATARAFSNWSNLTTSVRSEQIGFSTTSDKCGLTSSCSETQVNVHDKPLPTASTNHLQRSYSDGSCAVQSTNNTQTNQLPGIASMLHRRRLRALCRRCQYGKAAATLNKLYPQVLERCPELLVQLRCRQLIEMMRRHAVRRGRSNVCNSSQECYDSGTAITPAKIQKTTDSVDVGSRCCITNRKSDSTVFTNGISMDVDCLEDHRKTSTTSELDKSQNNNYVSSKTNSSHKKFDEADQDVVDDDVDGDALDDDDDDDDGFGIDDDTGVCLNSFVDTTATTTTTSNNNNEFKSILQSANSSTMDVDNEKFIDNSKLVTSSNITEQEINKTMQMLAENNNNNSILPKDDEMRCLLRHVQFGRSLVNLVRQVRAKTGGLSFETERLLQQSVSLLAYPSPTSKDCPLRGLLDPVWRDTIASIINSAVLKAHDLPAQPALEQGIRALQQCFQDRNFLEAQTLGHFLFYHLTPTQLTKIDEELVASVQQQQHPTTKRSLRSLSNQLLDDKQNDIDDSDPSSSTSHKAEINGHDCCRRRSRRQTQRHSRNTISEPQSSEHTDELNSSLEEVNKDEDEEEEEEEEEEGRCDSDDDDATNFDNDDDDDDEAESSGPVIRRPNTRSRNAASSGFSNSGDPSDNRSPNSDSSGHVRSHNYGNPNARFHSSLNAVQLSQEVVLARCPPTFLVDPARARVVAAMPSSFTSGLHRSNAPSRRFPASTIPARSQNRPGNSSAGSINPHPDPSFQGLLSMPYPYHAEFLAAVDDALKAYAGSILLHDDDQIIPHSEQNHTHGNGPPSPPFSGSGDGRFTHTQ